MTKQWRKDDGKEQKKEYMMIFVINVLLLLYTSIFLYGSPYALYKLFSVHTLLSVLGWILYAGGLYLILVWSEEGAEINQRCMVTALLIGGGTAILKAVIDVATNYLLSYIVPDNISGTVMKGVRNCGFGFAFLYFLFHYFLKGRERTAGIDEVNGIHKWFFAGFMILSWKIMRSRNEYQSSVTKENERIEVRNEK